jgi:hypothetical protein
MYVALPYGGLARVGATISAAPVNSSDCLVDDNWLSIPQYGKVGYHGYCVGRRCI